MNPKDGNQVSIVDFLEARLAEDEEVALASRDVNYQSNSGIWTFSDGEAEAEADSQRRFGGRLKTAVHASVRGGNFHLDDSGNPRTQNPDMIHIARHDPARILLDVAAKRKLIKSIEGLVQHAYGYDSAGMVEKVLAPLAAIYSDHPDFNEEWHVLFDPCAPQCS